MFKTRKREAVNFETPQEMYDDYKSRKINGIQDYQSKMIDSYMKDGINKSDVALELPTGTGKTLIGLLIAEFRRRKYKEKVVYVCPTSQLVYQTANYANELYGIKVIPFTGAKAKYETADKLKYNTASAVAVTNYSSIFNISSFFEGADVLIFDDAHSGENYISSNWTVNINREELKELYFDIINELQAVLTSEQYRILTKREPKVEDMSWCDMIHNAKLVDKYVRIQELIDKKIDESSERYAWCNIRNNVYACNIYLSWENIVIRPYIMPTLTSKAFSQAKRRIYMSATLGHSGEIERAYGVEDIHRLDMVKDWKNKDIGRRFFLFPLASFHQDQSINMMCQLSKRVNRALILVNDLKTQDGIQQIFLENKIGKTFNGRDIEHSKEEFINNDNTYAIMANRFDGIDFPNDECRTLILFEISTIAHIQEKFMITRLAAKTLFDEQIKTRVIQALGRCTRSQTDYAVICVLSDEVMNYLLSPKTLEKLNPELQAEIQFGYDNSIDQDDFNNILNMVDVFFEHKEDWDEAEDGILSLRDEIIKKGFKETNDAYDQLSKAVKHEVRYLYALWKNDYTKALSEAEMVLTILQSDELKGYRAYWNYIAGCCCFSLFKSGKTMFEPRYKDYFKRASEATIAVNWFEYEENLETMQNNDNVNDIILRLEKYISQHTRMGMKKFYEELDEICALLEAEDGHDFENGHERLGTLSGYRTTNPKGTSEPDPIWIINRELCIVSEDKIYKKDKEIPPNDIKQASGHAAWVKSKIEKLDLSDDVNVITVFITTATKTQENAALYGEGIYYLSTSQLISWADRMIEVIKELFRVFPGEGDSKWREQAICILRERKLTPKDFIDMITEKELIEI